MKVSKKIDKRIVASIILLLLNGLSMVLLHNFSDFFFSFYRFICKALINGVSILLSFTDFVLWDWALILSALVLIITLIIKSVRRKSVKNLLCNTILVISIMVFWMVTTFMNNHYAPTVAQEIGLTVNEYSGEELYQASDYYLNNAIALAEQMNRDENGEVNEFDFKELAVIAGSSYKELSKQYSIFAGSIQPVKKISLLGSYLLYNGITGMYMPITCESGVPANVYRISMPFTMAHEAAHRLAIASEEDCNFAAFLACINNKDLRFQYSGYYMAFRYCLNALVRYNPEMAQQLLDNYRSDEGYSLFAQDYNSSSTHYQQYESKLQEASDHINDSYLKLFSQEDGILSYGLVCDDLVCYYRANYGS